MGCWPAAGKRAKLGRGLLLPLVVSRPISGEFRQDCSQLRELPASDQGGRTGCSWGEARFWELLQFDTNSDEELGSGISGGLEGPSVASRAVTKVFLVAEFEKSVGADPVLEVGGTL